MTTSTAHGFEADLTGMVALVTGASSGLGAHFARVLARNGAEVHLAARRIERVERLAAEIGAGGAIAHAIALDITDREGVATAIEALDRTTPKIDILINNAGAGVVKPALEHTADDWDTTLQTNLTGTWTVAQAVGRGMVQRGSGAIVNVASLAGIGTSLFTPAYSASKAGVIQLTRQLAAEWARSGVRVNAICPGHFRTELNEDLFADDAIADKIAAKVPLRRIGEYSDLDGPLLLLASPASAYMTGVVLPVDGGQLIRPL